MSARLGTSDLKDGAVFGVENRNLITLERRGENMHESPWQVLHVFANHERRVAQHLSVRSLEHYLPLYTERSKWTDRSVILERPLFTGYVFVRFSPHTRFSVVSTPGVIRLLGEYEGDAVSPEEIDRIREGLASGCLLRPHPHVYVGTPVRVRSGVFEGVEGVVTEFRHQCRVIIALSAVKQCFSLELDLGDIQVLRKMPPGSEFALPGTHQNLNFTRAENPISWRASGI
jgi:transcription antitermination factor NusG